MLNLSQFNKSIIVYDEKVNDEVQIDISNISKYFFHIYCLCPMSDIIEPMDINKMILYKTSISIIRNPIHFGNIIYIDSQKILEANKFNYKLEENVLILPIYNISFLSLQKYIDNINNSYTLNNLYDILVINNYFGDNIKKHNIKMKITMLINNLEESKYWMYNHNCLMNLTKLFDKRNFNTTILKSCGDDIKKIFTNIEMSPLKGNYIQQLFKHKNYVDPSSVINKKGYKLYSKVWSCEYTNEDINKLFNILDDEQKYYLFSNLCVSKQYCHLVINNSYILDMMNSTIKKYSELYQYLFGYAWLRFYFEETINRYCVKTTDMYIFDINTASKLPVFYFDIKEPHKNPYCPIMVAENTLIPSKNVGGIKTHSRHNILNRICNLDEFKERMNVFISSNNKIDLLEDINLKELNMAITGSIMTACSQFSHPLLLLFKTYTDFNKLYNRFFDEYYYDSDIDIMVKTNSSFDFFDKTKIFYDKLCINLSKYFDVKKEDIKYKIIRASYLFVSSDFVKKYICNEEFNYDFIINNIDKPSIKKLFTLHAEELHKKECIKYKDYNKADYPELFTFDENALIIKIKENIDNETKDNKDNKDNKKESEFTQDELDIIINNTPDIEEKSNTINNDIITNYIAFSDTFKVHISSPFLKHDFEIFPINKNDFMNAVANFHMPCVRAYYDTNVYMTPSFISAHLTFMNIDYKYFAGSKDPINIINKYRMRGFGCWLNKTELDIYLKYCYEVPFWNNLLRINPHDKKTYDNVLGTLEISHLLFRPRHMCSDLITKPLPYDIYDYQALNEQEYLNEFHYNYYKYNKCYKFSYKNTFINKNTGYVNKLDEYIIIKTYNN